MFYLVQQPYKHKLLYRTKFENESKDGAIKILARYNPKSEVFSSNSYWIEDEKGNVVCSPRQTKKEAAKKYFGAIT